MTFTKRYRIKSSEKVIRKWRESLMTFYLALTVDNQHHAFYY